MQSSDETAGAMMAQSGRSAVGRDPENLRFILYSEARDWSVYPELQESPTSAMGNSRNHEPEPSSAFAHIHKTDLPLASTRDLRFYCIPSSYFRALWNPLWRPIRLHGNVFDGRSLTKWIYGWTAHVFGEGSYQLHTARRFGDKVLKLGAALSALEHCEWMMEKNVPGEVKLAGWRLWALLEWIIGAFMHLAEMQLAVSPQEGGRLEEEFVDCLCWEMIRGQRLYRAVDVFMVETKKWCGEIGRYSDSVLV